MTESTASDFTESRLVASGVALTPSIKGDPPPPPEETAVQAPLSYTASAASSATQARKPSAGAISRQAPS